MEKRRLREGWYGADTEVEFDDSVFDDIKKYFKLPEEVEILNAFYFVDEVTVYYEYPNGHWDSADLHVPISIVEEWFKAGYTILDESIKKPQAKKSNLTERFMTIHEKPSTRFNKNLKKVYEMLDKYGTKQEDVDKVFSRATLKERLEMVKLLKEGTDSLKSTNYALVQAYWDYGWYWKTIDKNTDGTVCYTTHNGSHKFSGNKKYTGKSYTSISECINEVANNIEKYLPYALPKNIDFVAGRRNGTIGALELNQDLEGYSGLTQLFDCKGGKLIKK